MEKERWKVKIKKEKNEKRKKTERLKIKRVPEQNKFYIYHK